MDRFDAMRVFTRVLERRSFTLAAEDLGIPRSTVTDAIKQLERRLGTQLFLRTTRHVNPTLDGQAYYQRCIEIIASIEDAEGGFSGAMPRGLLRVEVQGTLARHFLLPELPAFLEKYPDIELYMTEGDRFVDPVREGIDCVLRVGLLQDSDMIARRVAMLDEVTVASPAYLARFGEPRHPDQLTDGHQMIGFRASGSIARMPLEFMVDGKLRTVTIPAPVSVNAAESYTAAASLGLGIIQIPRYHAIRHIADGKLVQILHAYPPSSSPVSVVYPRDRQLSPRVRVFIDWIAMILARQNN
ncbi:LysR family transcriptional regulator [Brucella anthropi]|jgi:DNA-binding transcriptional LysR family regulator|uniref:LysR family transcriptional regulator n=2 Tax=Pseudomonadota TaxID=1224 RepID=A0A011T3R2_BRUAN|nr:MULTISPECIES: LysR family transcriptional regulator [Brucella/Ochrobactrum group]MCR5942036.1 LysR family transcriptional regulator [Ochrobactrum sp. XJ1]QOD65353.1 LysR family transcriptional regulator [Ochrobactrum sp. MT180101]QTN05111.1 LysR family transcriptional regulator [Ochrobactrum sp. EEELCW01]EXL06279.1 transcriptional regulator [Brucella anthropi]KAB2740191.1 LysR family transcriptional regulator [Brucella anthropi]